MKLFRGLLFSLVTLIGFSLPGAWAADAPFNGLDLSLGNLARTSKAKTRSISPENFTGEKAKAAMATTNGSAWKAAQDLGLGWKVSPYVRIKSKTTFTLGEITGPGQIQQIWMTPTGNWRYSILRFYWDDEKEPSVECPVGDFFGCGWGEYAQLTSLAVCVNPGSAFNCYWPMPFRKKARITMENLDDKEMTLYYQINYALQDVPKDAGYLHAQFRRVNPLIYKDVVTLVDGIEGQGHYVGTYLAWEVKTNGWWGEGEIKFFMDGDKEFPTIAGTGTEDYFCGSYNFDRGGKYTRFCTPYAGLPQVIPPDTAYIPPQRFGLYRWHILDPVRFEKDLRVTIQALGWQKGGKYLPLQDDIASVAYWYQKEPHKSFPTLPSRDGLTIQKLAPPATPPPAN